MPLYDYKCSKCGHIFEVQQKISEELLKFCPLCKSPIKRLISPAGIIFKGSGFHVTDYGKKETKEARPKGKTTPA
jgi:putative FmdB family regulatory protein